MNHLSENLYYTFIYKEENKKLKPWWERSRTVHPSERNILSIV